MKTLLTFCVKSSLCFLLLWASPCLAGSGMLHPRVSIDTGVPFNQYRPDDIAQLKQLVRGVGEMGCFDDVLPRMQRIGFEYYRIINEFADWRRKQIDGVSLPCVTRDKAGKIQCDFSRQKGIVKRIRAAGGEPYIIFGSYIPKVLRRNPNEGKHSLPRRKVYIDFVAAALKSLTEGADKEAVIYVEVGNEFDAPSQWYKKASYTAKFEKYMKLYEMVVRGVETYEKDNPDSPRVRVGGPAATCFGFAKTFETKDWGKRLPFNFIEQFMKECRKRKLRMDFVGWHTYTDQLPLHQPLGHGGSYPDLNRALAKVRGWRNAYQPKAEIIVSEWGFNGLYKGLGLQNYRYIAAASCMEMLNRYLQYDVDRAVFLTMRLPNAEKYFPHLLAADGTPLPVYRMMEMVVDLAPRRVQATWNGNHGTVNLIASTEENKQAGTALLWNTQWIHITDRKSAGHSEATPAEVTLRIPMKAKRVHIRSRVIDIRTPAAPVTKLSEKQYQQILAGKPLVNPKSELPNEIDIVVDVKHGVATIPNLLMLPESVRFLSWREVNDK